MIRCVRLTYVPRWCIVPMSRTQSVAEHSYRVAIIAGSLAEKLGFGPALVGNLLRMALLHDEDETISGDIPTPYKKAGNMGLYQTKAPGSAMESIMRVADLYEARTWVSAWGVGPRIPGIVAGIEADLTVAVDNASHLIPDFPEAYRAICAAVAEEE